MALSKERFKQKIQSKFDTRHLADHPMVLWALCASRRPMLEAWDAYARSCGVALY